MSEHELPTVPVITNEPDPIENPVTEPVEEYELEENLERIRKMSPRPTKFYTDEELRAIKEGAFSPSDQPTVPQEDYDKLVAKVVDLVRQQKIETWSWNKFFVGMSKVGVYELLLSIAVSISLAYIEQGEASLSTLLIGGAIAVLKALKQALRD